MNVRTSRLAWIEKESDSSCGGSRGGAWVLKGARGHDKAAILTNHTLWLSQLWGGGLWLALGKFKKDEWFTLLGLVINYFFHCPLFGLGPNSKQ